MTSETPIKTVRVIATGAAGAHYEHIHGTRKPTLWWILFGRRRVRLPINVYVVEHADGVVVFDTGQDRAVVTDSGYYPDRITAFLSRRIFDWDIGPEDTLAEQLRAAGYAAADVRKAVISHLHSDHVGGIAEIPEAHLYASETGFEYMRGPDHPERFAVYRDRIELPSAKWNTIPFAPSDDPALRPFMESFDLMGDGSLIVLPTPGHLAGSVSMLVRRGQRAPLLLIGDLTYDDAMLEQDELPAIGDKQELIASFAKVRELRAHLPGLVILPAHDPRAAEKLAAAS